MNDSDSNNLHPDNLLNLDQNFHQNDLMLLDK